jgi:hypothetical protein
MLGKAWHKNFNLERALLNLGRWLKALPKLGLNSSIALCEPFFWIMPLMEVYLL